MGVDTNTSFAILRARTGDFVFEFHVKLRYFVSFCWYFCFKARNISFSVSWIVRPVFSTCIKMMTVDIEFCFFLIASIKIVGCDGCRESLYADIVCTSMCTSECKGVARIICISCGPRLYPSSTRESGIISIVHISGCIGVVRIESEIVMKGGSRHKMTLIAKYCTGHRAIFCWF